MSETYEFIKGDTDKLKITIPHEPMIAEMSLKQMEIREAQLEADLVLIRKRKAKFIELQGEKSL